MSVSFSRLWGSTSVSDLSFARDTTLRLTSVVEAGTGKQREMLLFEA